MLPVKKVPLPWWFTHTLEYSLITGMYNSTKFRITKTARKRQKSTLQHGHKMHMMQEAQPSPPLLLSLSSLPPEIENVVLSLLNIIIMTMTNRQKKKEKEKKRL